MIKLEAELYTDTTASVVNRINGSHDEDHVIWTNAKIMYDIFDH